jgi:antitoxin (DNA-binding transcriptional repressor) of toxin-antitoxin stability system
MGERRIGVEELKANPSRCLEEVTKGTTLLLVDEGHRVARLVPEPRRSNSEGQAGNRLERAAVEEDEAQGAPAWRWQHGGHRQGEPEVRLLYVDTSALFKRYVEEDESGAVLARIEETRTVGTALITR